MASHTLDMTLNSHLLLADLTHDEMLTNLKKSETDKFIPFRNTVINTINQRTLIVTPGRYHAIVEFVSPCKSNDGFLWNELKISAMEEYMLNHVKYDLKKAEKHLLESGDFISAYKTYQKVLSDSSVKFTVIWGNYLPILGEEIEVEVNRQTDYMGITGFQVTDHFKKL